jgi:hypothetical protein
VAVTLLAFGGSAAQAAPITFDFGTGSNVSSGWAGTSNASASGTGVAITNPVLLDGGIMSVTGSSSLFCDLGVTAGTCGTATGLTTGTGYGLGVGDGRVDEGDTITITLANGGYTVSLVSFSLASFGHSATPQEQAYYTLDGGSQNVVTAPVTNVALDTFTVNSANFSTLVFGVPTGNGGNYDLASLTLNITANAVPEPATIGLVGLALVGLGATRRRWLKN